MRLFSEKVTPTYTRSAVNILKKLSYKYSIWLHRLI